jgi:hypothetical protein
MKLDCSLIFLLIKIRFFWSKFDFSFFKCKFLFFRVCITVPSHRDKYHSLTVHLMSWVAGYQKCYSPPCLCAYLKDWAPSVTDSFFTFSVKMLRPLWISFSNTSVTVDKRKFLFLHPPRCKISLQSVSSTMSVWTAWYSAPCFLLFTHPFNSEWYENRGRIVLQLISRLK